MDTASETSGPPPIDSTQSRTTANAGIAATTAPKPTRLATLSTGRTEALAPASTVSRRRQPPAVEQRPARRSRTRAPRPPTTRRSRPRGRCRPIAPPQGSSCRGAAGPASDITRLTSTTTTSGRIATSDAGGSRRSWRPWCISAGSNALAVVARSRTSGSSAAASDGHGALAVALALAPGGGLRAPEPPHAEAEHDRRRDHAQPGRGERRGAEERHRDRVLDRRRARQRGHRERRGAERDRRRHQATRDVRRRGRAPAPSARARRTRRTG